ncbi:DNA/RNA helicase, superfamily II, SNF2 family [Sphaerochaeta pleomorpha str. Grapes]|uniref:DNA/RNA helicase, superfamily II, SNF2 family n=1 Tax=Sphaerochaeta pleomorpha (strain ATCC BAA-1885 / DSM 22778 / Grapes) TaxID=158190 RepID=G8QTI1_SPHPG|nr:DEAD/DEAH box helicase [Sphaerochaeta pleomorpha]AEV30222.1 DNA/RNA helicase, superfamily II, SNF2 family [Sphaerochaeta pleomorpha str. Grapes]
MSNINFSHSINFETKRKAFPYQKEAFDAIKDLDYSAIFHEQGLGKTKIAIDLILYWLEKRSIDTVLIVTKKQLVSNWQKEFHSHTFISAKVLDSDKRNNYFILNSTARVVLTNFETISSEKERLRLYLKTRSVALVIDESTKIKNPDSKLTKDFFALSNLFTIRTIMTGTPVANRPYDIWSQIFFLDSGKSLGNNFPEFKQHTNLRNDFIENIEKREEFEQCVSEIYSKISSFTVRETKSSGIIQLPKKIYHDIYCNFEPTQLHMYKEIQNELSILVQKENETLLDDNEASLKRLIRLLQVSSNPRLIDDYYGYDSAKEVELKKILGEILNRSEKAIVWSCYIENINYFWQFFNEYQPARIHGKLSIEDRNKSVERFLEDPKCKILFATPQSAKEGLTLTVANNVIFYDRGFNLDDYLQAQDRIHRISQVKDCNIYNLMVRNSIDEWVSVLLQAKQNAAFLAQGDYQLVKYCEAMDYSYGDLIKEILSQEVE